MRRCQRSWGRLGWPSCAAVTERNTQQVHRAARAPLVRVCERAFSEGFRKGVTWAFNILNAHANALQLSGPYRYRSLDTASREALYEEVMHAVLNYR